MKIVDVVTEDIGDFRTIVEILNGFIPEANADFIKDVNEYGKKLDKKTIKNKTKSNTGESDDSEYIPDNESTEIIKHPKKKVKKKLTKGCKKKSKKKYSSDEQSDNDLEKSDDNDNINDNDEPSSEEHNPGEIKILTMDPNQVMITFIRLKGSSFKKFKIMPATYRVGLNLDELYKYIKNVDKDGTMNIYIDDEDLQKIVFNVSNSQAPRVSICELRVMNLGNRQERKIEANVAMAVRIPCAEFHKACKDLLQFSQYVEITCDPSQFVITCQGDMSAHSRIFKADGSEHGIIIKMIKRDDDDDAPKIIRLIFDLKYINTMYKCSGLCDDMEIYLNTDSVMFLKYGIKLMGEMLVGISPSSQKKNNADNNYDEDDELFYQDDEEIKLK